MNYNINKSIEDYKKELMDSYRKSANSLVDEKKETGNTKDTETSDSKENIYLDDIKKDYDKMAEDIKEMDDALIAAEAADEKSDKTDNTPDTKNAIPQIILPEIKKEDINVRQNDTPTEQSEVSTVPLPPTELINDLAKNDKEDTKEPQMGKSQFRAEVYTAQQAYPIEGAKVKLYKDGNLIAFLTTNKNGATDNIELESPPEINSLEPFNPFKTIEYLADIYADNFITKKGLPVQVVGGTQAILKTNLTPAPERVN